MMAAMTQLPPLNVQRGAALDIIRAIIGDGERLVAEFALGAHNPRIVLQHRIRFSRWASANIDRVNALFSKPVLSPGDLLSTGGDTLDLATLRSLMGFLGPLLPEATPQLLEQGQKPLQGLQEQFHALNIERVGLHAKVLERCRELYAAKKYDDAVFNAFKLVETKIRAGIGADPEDLGTDLVAKAMSPKKPILRFSSVFAEQEGFYLLPKIKFNRAYDSANGFKLFAAAIGLVLLFSATEYIFELTNDPTVIAGREGNVRHTFRKLRDE
jgi:hypothetical protein